MVQSPSSTSYREVVVVAAAILQQGQTGIELFIARRAPHDQGAGVWEFPGGKVEAGESLENALIREIQEELSVQIRLHDYLGQNDYFLTPQLLMHLHVYCATIKSGTIQLVDHDAFEWHVVNNFPTDKISKADRPFVMLLQENFA